MSDITMDAERGAGSSTGLASVKVLGEKLRKETLEYAAYSFIEGYKAKNGGRAPSRVWLDCAMFLLAERLKLEGVMDVRLPYAWFAKGPEVQWDEFTDMVVFL